MKKFVNGYDRPRFKIHLEDGTIRTIDVSFKYQALEEYYEEIVTLDKFTDGSNKMTFHHYDYEWRLFYDQYIEKADRLLIAEVERALARGLRVQLIPHIDYHWRAFFILIKPETKVSAISYHHKGSLGTYNKNFEISFINQDAIRDVSIADTDYIPVIGCKTFEEF